MLCLLTNYDDYHSVGGPQNYSIQQCRKFNIDFRRWCLAAMSSVNFTIDQVLHFRFSFAHIGENDDITFWGNVLVWMAGRDAFVWHVTLITLIFKLSFSLYIKYITNIYGMMILNSLWLCTTRQWILRQARASQFTSFLFYVDAI